MADRAAPRRRARSRERLHALRHSRARRRPLALSRAWRSRCPPDGTRAAWPISRRSTACVQAAVRRRRVRSASAVVDAMVVGIGGASIDGHNVRGLYEFGRPRAVTLEDMAYAVERAEHVRLEDDRMLLQLFPQDFTLDGRSGKRKPHGATMLAPGSQRPHRHGLRAGARRHRDRGAPGFLRGGGNGVRAGGRRLRRRFARGSRPRRGGGGYRHAFERTGGLRRRSRLAGAQHSAFRPIISRATSPSA